MHGIRVLLLRDRRAGHFNQVEGVASAIATLTQIEVDRLELRPRPSYYRKLRKWLFRRFDDRRVLNLLYGIEIAELATPDFVVGSGRGAFAAGALIARLTNAKFIYSGFVSDYDTRDADLLLVQSPRQAHEPNCVLVPLPCMVDANALPPIRRLRGVADLAGANLNLLLGGKASGYRYSGADWRNIADLVAETAVRYGVRWSVSNSRRTPVDASLLFSELRAQGRIERFIDVRDAGQSASIADLYGGDAIVVTEDSTTMISEAVAARRPVVALKPQVAPSSSATETLSALASTGSFAVLPARSTSADLLARILVALEAPVTNPRAVIAAAIAPLLPLTTRKTL